MAVIAVDGLANSTASSSSELSVAVAADGASSNTASSSSELSVVVALESSASNASQGIGDAIFVELLDGITSTASSASATTTVANPITGLYLQEDDPAFIFGAFWETHTDTSHSGGAAKRTRSVEATVDLYFTGTGITILGMKGPDQGVARVNVDGTDYGNIDLYAETTQYQAVIFELTGLSNTEEHAMLITHMGAGVSTTAYQWLTIDVAVVEGEFRRVEVVDHELTLDSTTMTLTRAEKKFIDRLYVSTLTVSTNDSPTPTTTASGSNTETVTVYS